ncbi:MAG: hypothetical protein ABJE95_19555 [Byssovorax sp.]
MKRVFVVLLAAGSFSFAGCAAWNSFTRAAAPIARAVMGAVESAGCTVHTAAGVPESDPRAVVIHDAGAAVDRLAQASTPDELAALAAAVRAFEVAIEEVTGGLPITASGATP